MQIIRKSERKTETYYQLEFSDNGCPGAGFSFLCNEAGEVDTASLACDAARDNLAACLDGTHNVTARGVRKYQHSYTEPAVGLCCGQEIELYGFTNTCPRCGSDYNFAGQLLADRRFWDGTDGAGSPGYC